MKYELVFEEASSKYERTLNVVCFGEEGYKEEPPEGWDGKMKLPNNIGFINYKIDPNSRKYFHYFGYNSGKYINWFPVNEVAVDLWSNTIAME